MLSVIIPVYNTQPYIGECVQSILSADIEKEIIIIDDGSTDGSREELARYADNPAISIFSQPNAGLSASRNKGMALAKGEYVSFIDSDDFIDGSRLKILYEAAQEKSVDLASGNTAFWYDGSRIEKRYNIPDCICGKYVNGGDCLTLLMENGIHIPMACNYLYRKSFLDKCNYIFKDIVHEDELWNIQMFSAAESVLVTDCVFYNYRQREDSIMHSVSNECNRRLSFIKIAEELVKMVSERISGDGIEFVQCVLTKGYQMLFYALRLTTVETLDFTYLKLVKSYGIMAKKLLPMFRSIILKKRVFDYHNAIVSQLHTITNP